MALLQSVTTNNPLLLPLATPPVTAGTAGGRRRPRATGRARPEHETLPALPGSSDREDLEKISTSLLRLRHGNEIGVP